MEPETLLASWIHGKVPAQAAAECNVWVYGYAAEETAVDVSDSHYHYGTWDNSLGGSFWAYSDIQGLCTICHHSLDAVL